MAKKVKWRQARCESETGDRKSRDKTEKKTYQDFILDPCVNATSRPSHELEGGVTQRWCESAEWI
jgi:hypothetical protein